MKTSLLKFFTVLLVLFSPLGGLKASPEFASNIAPIECTNVADDLLMPYMDNPCYPPDWHYTSGITQYSAIFQWESVYGAYGYSIQWRYPNGSWYDVPGTCYDTWINVSSFQPCSSYEWRVRSHCGSGYYSSWCYPVYFTTLCNNCPKPYSTYTTNVTENSASLHWSEVWGAQSYTVQIQWPGGSWTTLSGSPCQDTWLNVYGLEPGTSYDWRVRANCGYSNYSDWAYGWFSTSESNYCNYPPWLNCYNITEYSATWKWASVYGADYYAIQWRYPGGSWYDLSGGPFYGTWCNVTHMSPCTTYEWRVKSYCHYGGWSYWSYHNTFTTSCHSSCPVPSGLITKDIGDTKATFKWSPVYGASNYSVQLKDQWGNWYDIPGSPTSGTWITVYNLSPCKTYEWRVRANCHYDSHSYWSKSKHFTTTCGNGCRAPEWVYTNGISNTFASLHWAPVSGVDYYVVEWRQTGGTFAELQGGPFTNTWADLTGLTPSTSYEWRVKSHCITGVFSDWSSVTSFTTLGNSCGIPFFRYTLPITDSTATFNWSPVNGALNYTVQIRLPGGAWQDVPGSPTTATSITATGLVPNTQYEWRMQVNCNNGAYSPWLSAITFYTGTSSGCATPSSLSTDSLTLTSAILNWDSVPGAETYSVEIRLSPSGAWNPVVGSPVDTNTILVDGLTPFTAYEWRVRANCTGGLHSFWSGAVQFTTTDQPPCPIPGNLAADSITETTAILHWSPVPTAQVYQVQIRFPNGPWIDAGDVIGDTTLLASGLTPNTTYEWRVRAKCDSNMFSNWSSVATFNTTGTLPINDDCASATLLTVETGCVNTFASNAGTTASIPPPVGGCESNDYKDVWFKFTMPDTTNPTVTIRTTAGSLANAVMEVYSGTECSVLSLIACEDNNDNGNGSAMPVINLTGTPSTTIWVRVWGHNGTTGTFTICVFNYISLNYNEFPDDGNPEVGEPLVAPEEASPKEMELNDEAEILISPNPASDQLNIMVRQTDERRVIGLSMIDLSGKRISSQDMEPVAESEFRYSMDVSNLEPGMYVLQVLTTSGMMTEKVSVIK
jgi:hypothetical protein